MILNSLDAVFYTCVFLLPGFIIKSIVDSLVPPARHNDVKYFFTCLTYSIINCAIWCWAYSWVVNSVELSMKYWLLLLVITLIGASVLGLIIGCFKYQNGFEKLLKKIRIKKSQPIPSAWDYFFSKQETVWVIVTSKNGKTIYGLYADNSFASSDPEERDLFIEKTYILENGKTWIEDESSLGILLSQNEIETIEFLKGENNGNGKEE